MIAHQMLFAKNVALLIQFIFSTGYGCTMGEAHRTHEQALIYASQKIGIIDSQHCDRLAIDLNVFSPDGKYLSKTEDYKRFGEYWEKLSKYNRWGGRFKSRPDGNHFEMEDL